MLHVIYNFAFVFRPDRQFRFEERDRSGQVKGLYGFYDNKGKLQLVNYDAHPREGFHAEGNFGKF